MKDRILFKEWMKLSKEERIFVKEFTTPVTYNPEIKRLASKAFELGFFIVDKEYQLIKTNKYLLLEKSRISNSLNLKKLETQLINGTESKEHVHLILDIYEERIKELRVKVDGLAKQYENCEHDFKPVEAEWRLCLFKIDKLYTWNLKCSKCGCKTALHTKNNELKPDGFENITARDCNLNI